MSHAIKFCMIVDFAVVERCRRIDIGILTRLVVSFKVGEIARPKYESEDMVQGALGIDTSRCFRGMS